MVAQYEKEANRMKGSRLRAKGEKIIFDTEDGKKEYELRPLKNRQLLEIVELADKKEGLKSAILMAKYSLNADPKIVNGTEEPFTDEEMDEMDSPFLIQILKTAAEINGLGDMFDFQLRGGKQSLDPNLKESENPYEVLNKNPVKRI